MPAPNRLTLALHRLYLPPDVAGPLASPDGAGLVDAGGRVRAVVLQIARPADWSALSGVWQGVQADLDLPAPAIAVNGIDACQLWFSLAEPLPAAQAAAFGESLRLRYLGAIGAHRVTVLPTVEPAPPWRVRHAAPVPARQVGGERWSAFVAPDLAPMFANEPWLDLPPSEDGQASLLSPLASIAPAALQRAQRRLAPAEAPPDHAPAASPAALPVAAAEPARAGLASAGPWQDPRRFLLDVMNDGTVALDLRIDAAKALLPPVDPARRT